MKKVVVLFSALLFTLAGFSQKVTNQENSQYSFEKLVHLDATPVLSQGQTGTCWSFSALSFFESELIRKGMKDAPALSEMFIVRHAYREKAEKFIRMDGKLNFAEGGAFHDIPLMWKKYGIVPAEVFQGLNYGLDKHNHVEFFSALNGYVQGVLEYVNNMSKGSVLSSAWKAGLEGILDAYLGKIPEKFTYKGKEYTPKSFSAFLGLNMDDYVSITSFTHHPYYSTCMLEIQDNWNWGTSYNVPLDELMEIAVQALKSGYTVAWGADVSEAGFNFREGIAIVPADPSTIQIKGKDNRNYSDAGAVRESNAFMQPVKELLITPELRQQGYDNKTTQDDHGMHITGLYKEAGGTLFFLVKNSWGTGNFPQGFLYVSEHYFRYKTINIYLHKDALSKELRKKLGIA
jgi:bleomycin hydrolase